MNCQIAKRLCVAPGVYLNFEENDRYKTNYLSLFFVTPLNRRTASYNTLLSRVLTCGCEKYPNRMSLNRALDHAFDAQLDSETAKVGEWHALCLSLCLLDNAFSFNGEDITAEGMELIKEVLIRPYLPQGAFSEAFLEREKKLALDEIAALINHKARYAKSRMIEHMCKLEPYSTCSLGHKGELRKIDSASLTAYYRELLATARVEIFCVGRFDREKAAAWAKALFCGVERREEALPPLSIRTKARSVREVTETMDITQANLVMGFRTASTVYDSHWSAMSLYNAVLGGSLTSKLFCVLREKMSLCYSVSSSPDGMKGIMSIYAGIAPENRDLAVKEALNQMDEIKKGNVSEEELENARGALIHSLNGLQDNPAVLAEWYLPRVLAGCPKTPQELIADLKAVTLDQVIAVAEKIRLDTVYTLTAKEGKQ
jgi:predicted Zn-dependent peptidase